MATIAIVPTKLSRGSHKWIWEAMGDDDVGAALDPNGGGINFADKTFHVVGTFGGSVLVVLQGSNDGTNWVTLTDPQGAVISSGTTILVAVLENPLYIRPKTSGGTSADVDVILSGRATLQLR